MKIAVWSVFAVVALLWTAGAALLAMIVDWSAQGLAAGAASPMGDTIAEATVPEWLAPWMDVAGLTALQDVAGAALTSASAFLPAIGGAVGWLVPAVWVIWACGLLALIILAVVATSLLRRFPHQLPLRRPLP